MITIKFAKLSSLKVDFKFQICIKDSFRNFAGYFSGFSRFFENHNKINAKSMKMMIKIDFFKTKIIFSVIYIISDPENMYTHEIIVKI